MTLLLGDCLERLKEIPAESVDLVYLDPPFNTGKTWKSDAGEFGDSWRGDAVDAVPPLVRKVVEAAEAVGGEGSGAYLSFVGARLVELRRVLKPTGSLWLHCDTTAGHALKMVLDAVFGSGAFRNEIVWFYPGGSRIPRAFPRKHDTIFFYAKDAARVKFNRQFIPYTPEAEKLFNRRDEDGRLYGISFGGQRTYYRSEGRLLTSVWTDIPSFQFATNAPERAGYPTQKPLKLLRRIVDAGSDVGDLVLDPFCGSGTTLVAAQALRRRFVGIDVSEKAVALSRKRLEAAEDPFAP